MMRSHGPVKSHFFQVQLPKFEEFYRLMTGFSPKTSQTIINDRPLLSFVCTLALLRRPRYDSNTRASITSLSASTSPTTAHLFRYCVHTLSIAPSRSNGSQRYDNVVQVPFQAPFLSSLPQISRPHHRSDAIHGRTMVSIYSVWDHVSPVLQVFRRVRFLFCGRGIARDHVAANEWRRMESDRAHERDRRTVCGRHVLGEIRRIILLGVRARF